MRKTRIGKLARATAVAVIIAPLVAFDGQAGQTTTSLDLRNTITGDPLNLDEALPEGRDTEGVKQFLATGQNPYNEVKTCFPSAKDFYLTACSGCHGEYAEGKIGPNLADNYWTYPVNTSDIGLFATIFGGANGMMGPHNGDLTLDQILQVMAWVRHLYSGPVANAPWFTDEQKKAYVPYQLDKDSVVAKADGLCAVPIGAAKQESGAPQNRPVN
ncbi:cytochrome c(L), periplasmic [Beijerinckiaceae bacterium]|nr:cytochrome c(L), periplasmic [Beijerinckiaceae bacterium]